MPYPDLSLCEARRVALAARGFDRPRPSGRVGKRDLRRTIRQLGLLQIDYCVEIFVAKPRRRWGYYVFPFFPRSIVRANNASPFTAYSAGRVLHPTPVRA